MKLFMKLLKANLLFRENLDVLEFHQKKFNKLSAGWKLFNRTGRRFWFWRKNVSQDSTKKKVWQEKKINATLKLLFLEKKKISSDFRMKSWRRTNFVVGSFFSVEYGSRWRRRLILFNLDLLSTSLRVLNGKENRMIERLAPQLLLEWQVAVWPDYTHSEKHRRYQ